MKRFGYILVTLLVGIFLITGGAIADETRLVNVYNSSDLAAATAIVDEPVIINLCANISISNNDINKDIKFKENQTLYSNGYTIYLQKYTSITVTKDEQLKEIIKNTCVIGDGTLKHQPEGKTDEYYSVYIGISGSGWLSSTTRGIEKSYDADPGYVYVKNKQEYEDTPTETITGFAKAYQDNTLELSNVVVVNNNAIDIIKTVIFTPNERSGAEFICWMYKDLDGSDEMRKLHPYDIGPGFQLTAKFTSAVTTSKTIFYYQVFKSPNLIPPGTYYHKNRENCYFTISQGDNFIAYSDQTPEGIYYLDGDTSNSPVHLQLPYLTEQKITVNGKSTSEVLYNDTVTVNINYAADVQAKLAFKAVGGDGYFSKLGGDVTTFIPGKQFSFVPGTETKKYEGNWEIYADFTDSMDSSVSDNKDITCVKIGTIVVLAAPYVNASASISKTSVTNNTVFALTVSSPKTPYSYVSVKYYLSGSGNTFLDGAEKVTENTKIAFYNPESQDRYFSRQAYAREAGIPEENWVEPGFYTDANGKAYINLIANTGNTNTEKYVIAVSVKGCTGQGSQTNPCLMDVSVNGNSFTLTTDKENYALGENIRASGSYAGSTFSPYFYLEGTNTNMVKLSVAIKDNNYGVYDYRVSGGSYYYVLDGDGTASLNPGVYILYASTYNSSTDGRTEGISIDERKRIVNSSQTRTIFLGLEPIEILDIDTYVEPGITNDNTSRYLTIKVKATAADMISLYIVGQNKVFYINGKEALQKGYLKNLNANDNTTTYFDSGYTAEEINEFVRPYHNYNYLFKIYGDNKGNDYYTDNPYYFYSASGYQNNSSLGSVLSKLGMLVPIAKAVIPEGKTEEEIEPDPANYRWYPNYLIIGGENSNTDGIFTIYIHMQELSEISATTVKATDGKIVQNVIPRQEYDDKVIHPLEPIPYIDFTEEVENNTVFMDGEYYVIVQHPMADNIFNTYGVGANKDKNNTGYTTGVNIYKNGDLMFNVPSLENINAAQRLTETIVAGNDTFAGTTINVFPNPESYQEIYITRNKDSYGPEDLYTVGKTYSFSEGDTVRIFVIKPDLKSYFATFEQNEFDISSTDNINYIKSFTTNETWVKEKLESVKLTTVIDGTPSGKYQIILKGKSSTSATLSEDMDYRTIVVADATVGNATTKDDTQSSTTDTSKTDTSKTDSGSSSSSSSKSGSGSSSGSTTKKTDDSSIKYVPDTKKDDTKSTKTPVPLLGIIAGLGVSAFLVLRRR